MKIHQKKNSIKLRKMRKRKRKIYFINKKKKCVQSSQEKMEVCQIERNKKCSWVKANKIPKKKNSLGWKPKKAI